MGITWETLYDGLLMSLETNNDKYVIIRADKNAWYGDITEAMGIAKAAGAKSITIATEQKQEKAGA